MGPRRHSWKKYHAPSDDRRYAELTLQGCKDLCSSTPGCDTFAWNQDGPMCYMRKLILPHRFDLCSASPGWEGFYRDVGWTVTASTYCHAGVSTNGLLGLGRFRETALGTKFGQNDCRALCQDTATCNGFAYSNYYCDLYNFRHVVLERLRGGLARRMDHLDGPGPGHPDGVIAAARRRRRRPRLRHVRIRLAQVARLDERQPRYKCRWGSTYLRLRRCRNVGRGYNLEYNMSHPAKTLWWIGYIVIFC